MNKYGLLIAQDGSPLNHGRNKVDTGRQNLIVDLEANPAHMDIITLDKAGTAYVDDGSFTHKQEILFTIPHRYGFSPLCSVYFYVTATLATSGPALNTYSTDQLILTPTGGSTMNDVVSFEADHNDFRIVHNFDSFASVYGIPGTGIVSSLPKLTLRVKYYIYGIDSGRDMNYGSPVSGLTNLP